MSSDAVPSAAPLGARLPDTLEGWATINPDRSVTLRLEVPVEAAGAGRVEELTFRRPKGKELRRIDKGNGVAGLFDWTLDLCGKPSTVGDQLDAADAWRVLEVGGFFGPTPPGIGRR